MALAVAVSNGSITIEYLVVEPAEMGTATMRPITIAVPAHISDIHANASGCMEDVVWESCGLRTITLTPSPRCTWPIGVDFVFENAAFGEAATARRYTMEAKLGRLDRNVSDACRLRATPPPSEVLVMNGVSASEVGAAYATRLCVIRQRGSDPRAIWSLHTTDLRTSLYYNGDLQGNSRFQQVPPDRSVQTSTSPVWASIDLALVTSFPRKKPIRMAGPRDTELCFCGYNVVCREGALKGSVATGENVLLGTQLETRQRPDLLPFRRTDIQSSVSIVTYVGSVAGALLSLSSLLLLGAAAYLYFTQKVFILRDTDRTREIVDTFQ